MSSDGGGRRISGRRSDVQCLHRWQKVLRPGLRKGPWTKDEDAVVLDFVTKAGGVSCIKWSVVASQVPGPGLGGARRALRIHAVPRAPATLSLAVLTETLTRTTAISC